MTGEKYFGRKQHHLCGTYEKYVSCGACVACSKERDKVKKMQQRLRSLRNKTIQLQESY